MIDKRQRLIHCFKAVFPDLSESEVAGASTSSVLAWDSVATVTLLAAIEEEFGIQLSFDEIERMSSFENWLARISEP